MSILLNSIKDDLNRNIINQKIYQKKIDSLCRGKIVIRKKRKSLYYYLEYRDGDKINNDYLGPVKSFDKSVIENEIYEREVYKQRLMSLKKDEKEMKTVLKSLGELA